MSRKISEIFVGKTRTSLLKMAKIEERMLVIHSHSFRTSSVRTGYRGPEHKHILDTNTTLLQTTKLAMRANELIPSLTNLTI